MAKDGEGEGVPERTSEERAIPICVVCVLVERQFAITLQHDRTCGKHSI